MNNRRLTPLLGLEPCMSYRTPRSALRIAAERIVNSFTLVAYAVNQSARANAAQP
jgi:hypothetical protein